MSEPKSILVLGAEDAFVEIIGRCPTKRYLLLYAEGLAGARQTLAKVAPSVIVANLDGDGWQLIPALREARRRGTIVVGLTDESHGPRQKDEPVDHLVQAGAPTPLIEALRASLGEQRRWPRVQLDVEVLLDDGDPRTATMLSAASIFVSTDEQREPGQLVELVISLDGVMQRCQTPVLRVKRGDANGVVLGIPAGPLRNQLQAMVAHALLSQFVSEHGAPLSASLKDKIAARSRAWLSERYDPAAGEVVTDAADDEDPGARAVADAEVIAAVVGGASEATPAVDAAAVDAAAVDAAAVAEINRLATTLTDIEREEPPAPWPPADGVDGPGQPPADGQAPGQQLRELVERVRRLEQQGGSGQSMREQLRQKLEANGSWIRAFNVRVEALANALEPRAAQLDAQHARQEALGKRADVADKERKELGATTRAHGGQVARLKERVEALEHSTAAYGEVQDALAEQAQALADLEHRLKKLEALPASLTRVNDLLAGVDLRVGQLERLPAAAKKLEADLTVMARELATVIERAPALADGLGYDAALHKARVERGELGTELTQQIKMAQAIYEQVQNHREALLSQDRQLRAVERQLLLLGEVERSRPETERDDRKTLPPLPPAPELPRSESVVERIRTPKDDPETLANEFAAALRQARASWEEKKADG